MADPLDALPYLLWGTDDVPLIAPPACWADWSDDVLDALEPSRAPTRRELVDMAALLDRLGLPDEAARMMALS